MVGGTEFLAVGGVEGVGDSDGAPAGIVLGLAHRGAVLLGDDAEHDVVALVPLDVEGHRVVDFRLCQTHVERLFEFAVDKDVYAGILVALLHGQEDVFAGLGDADQGVVDTQDLDL